MEDTFTAVLYNLGKTVAHVLSLPLALHHSLAPGLEHVKDDEPDSHKYDDVPPELGLLIAVIIVLKMVYGFDGRRRCVRGQASARLFLFTQASDSDVVDQGTQKWD
jgi:RNA polymerase I-specific transcription initiation factor RRN7